MHDFTNNRTAQTKDEVWLLQHPPVYTQGQAGRAEHVLEHNHIPIVQADRGGQITYHGPGQLIVYLLLDLKRLNIGIRNLVDAMETALMATLADYGIKAQLIAGKPGVYVQGSKIASLGLRVRKGCTFHGMALNIAMGMAPFQAINPCGYIGMPMTQVNDWVAKIEWQPLEKMLVEHLIKQLNYAETQWLFTDNPANIYLDEINARV